MWVWLRGLRMKWAFWLAAFFLAGLVSLYAAYDAARLIADA